MKKLAEKWIDEADKISSSKGLKLKGLYYQALIEITNGKLEEARRTLLEALEHKEGSTTAEEYAIAQIALARVSYTIGDNKEAIKYYKAVSKNTSSFVDASYELIFTYYKAKDFKNAYKQSIDFVRENPNHENTKFANSLTSFMGIKAGILDQTEYILHDDIKFLTKFAQELNGKLRKR